MSGFVRVASVEELSEGEVVAVEVAGREIALVNIRGVFFAIDNICPHMGGPLVEGLLDGPVLSCPWHAWTFDVRTGQCTFNADIRVEKFEVRVNGSDVEVRVGFGGP